MTTLQALQLITFVVILAGVIMTLHFVKTHRDQWPYALAPLSWLLHVSVFYIMLLLCRYMSLSIIEIDFTLWSAIVRMQAAFLILGLFVLAYMNRVAFK